MSWIHLLPEVAEAQEESGIEYPLCFFFVVLGYLLLLLFEKVSRFCQLFLQ